jgi:hypothetical protein
VTVAREYAVARPLSTAKSGLSAYFRGWIAGGNPLKLHADEIP